MTNPPILKSASFPRSDHVDILVQRIDLGNADKPAEYIEIREYIKNGEIHGHGLVMPANRAKALIEALNKIQGKA